MVYLGNKFESLDTIFYESEFLILIHAVHAVQGLCCRYICIISDYEIESFFSSFPKSKDRSDNIPIEKGAHIFHIPNVWNWNAYLLFQYEIVKKFAICGIHVILCNFFFSFKLQLVLTYVHLQIYSYLTMCLICWKMSSFHLSTLISRVWNLVFMCCYGFVFDRFACYFKRKIMLSLRQTICSNDYKVSLDTL